MNQRVLLKTKNVRKERVSLRTFNKVKGAPIIHGQKNLQLGIITDLTYCANEGRITGFWIQDRHWWSKKHVLPLWGIVEEKNQCFIVDSKHPFIPIKASEARFLHGKNRLIGRAVNQDGGMVGIVEDVYFLPDSGKILGYEMTEGLFEDLSRGFKVVKTGHFAINKDDQSLLIY